jgi:hypothetical protein
MLPAGSTVGDAAGCAASWAAGGPPFHLHAAMELARAVAMAACTFLLMDWAAAAALPPDACTDAWADGAAFARACCTAEERACSCPPHPLDTAEL